MNKTTSVIMIAAIVAAFAATGIVSAVPAHAFLNNLQNVQVGVQHDGNLNNQQYQSNLQATNSFNGFNGN